MSAPSFSGVIPACNAAATLASAIRSVLIQTRPDFELIVVDDGSQDETLELARSFEVDDRVRVLAQPNAGLAAARNAGIAHARGRYVGMLDSDDLWMPTYLEEMGAALDAEPGAGFAYTDGWALDEKTGRIRRATTMARQRPPAHPPRDPDQFLRLLVRRNFIPAETLIRKAAIDAVGAFNTSLRAVEDYELWLRLLSHGYGAVRAPGVLLVRRDSPFSMSKDELRMFTAFHEVWRLVADEHPAPEEVKQAARARMRWAEREIRILNGQLGTGRALRLARLALGRLKRRLMGRRLYYDEPPVAVARLLARVRSPV